MAPDRPTRHRGEASEAPAASCCDDAAGEVAFQRANQLVHQDKLQQASDLYQQILRDKPNHVGALINLGTVYVRLDRPEQAQRCFVRAVEIDPSVRAGWMSLGQVLRQGGDLDRAESCYLRAGKLDSDDAVVHHRLGQLYLEQQRPDQAIAALQQAVTIEPNRAQAWFDLGLGAKRLGDRQRAIRAYQQALRVEPDWAQAHLGIGMLLLTTGRVDLAQSHLQRAVDLDDALAPAWHHLGIAQVYHRQIEQGQISAARAVELAPDEPSHRVALAQTQLMLDDWPQAWSDLAHQTRLSPRAWLVEQILEDLPQWDGQRSIKRQRLLLLATSDSADDVWLIRYATWLKKLRPAHVAVCSEPGRAALLAHAQGIDQVLTSPPPPPPEVAPEVSSRVSPEVAPAADASPGESVGRKAMVSMLHDFDLCIPLHALPACHGSTPDDLPTDGPYIHLDGQRLNPEAARRLEVAAGKRKVGLIWATQHDGPLLAERSASLMHFQPVTQLPGIQLVSLQTGPDARALTLRTDLPVSDLPIIDMADLLSDAVELGCVMRQMDLVMAVDSPAAHLAGAMGLPVWVLLSYSPDARWVCQGDTTPWYPTMRLFRMARRHDWADVIRQVCVALRTLPWDA